MKKGLPLSLFFCVLGFLSLQAQLKEVPISTIEAHSKLIVEGKVVSRESFWNAGFSRIYTLYQIQVFDCLKGLASQSVKVVQIGGCVGNECHTLFPRLELGVGQEGIFFLYPFNDEDFGIGELFQVVSGPLGFITFLRENGQLLGANPFRVFTDLDIDIYLPIANRRMGSRPRIENRPVPESAPSISSLTPDTLAAGVNDTLTIHGTEFGPDKGIVWFQQADYPLGVFVHGEDPEILVWTDSLIQVIVPSEGSLDSSRAGIAATGKVRVQTGLGMVAESATEIFIKYAYRTRRVAFDSTAKTMVLNNPSGSPTGGYAFRLDTNFNSIPQAREVFTKALRDWRCATLANFSLGADTVIRMVQADGINAVYWDTLKPGTVGITLAREQFCRDQTSGIDYYHTLEIDIVFDSLQIDFVDTVAIPGAGLTDFYSVALHELGHGHLLHHVNRPGFFMHRNIATGTTIRVISPEILEGGLTVVDSSKVSHNPSCPDPMIPLSAIDCGILGLGEAIYPPISHVTLYPVPSSLAVEVQMRIMEKLPDLRMEIYNPMGQMVLTQNMGVNSPGITTFSLGIGHLPNGLYILNAKCEKGMVSRSFTVQH